MCYDFSSPWKNRKKETPIRFTVAILRKPLFSVQGTPPGFFSTQKSALFKENIRSGANQMAIAEAMYERPKVEKLEKIFHSNGQKEEMSDSMRFVRETGEYRVGD